MADATATPAATEAKKPKKEVIVETVTMEDKRIVDFPGKKRLHKESFIADDGTVTVRLDFRHGKDADLHAAG